MIKARAPPAIQAWIPKLAAKARINTYAIADLGDEDLDGLDTLLLAEIVGTILNQSLRRLRDSQSSVGARAELSDHCFCWESMRWTRQGSVGLSRHMILHFCWYLLGQHGKRLENDFAW
ncbi:hypothetical protein HG531_007543 [Fusarium graminearum]|nr:hypothetical protein HG531_007543 [Fusarium graminearum]